jgi:hypothetical protein
MKAETKTEYTDLAPIDEIENGAEYLNAMHWALNNKRIKNIALAGPYGSGKSSIIESYLKQHPLIKKKTLRISMATFVEVVVDHDGKLQKIDIEQEEIELGILKQLFYKVDYKKIPQSRYRKLHRIGLIGIFGFLVVLSIIAFLMGYIFFPKLVESAINKIDTAGSSIGVTKGGSLLLFTIPVSGIFFILAVAYRSFMSRFRVKEIKLPVDTTVKSGEESTETVFDKYIDEIVYFFEETKYRLVFFEDLDRLEDSSIFVHLRELNTLLNNYDVIKEPIVFVYAVKDDIFSVADRTKFFDFIVPVIPIINSTNSGEILLGKLDGSKRINIEHQISQSFVLDVSPYISDMRILQNIYNEFIVYKKTLRIEQDLKLLDEPMMALVVFKNLYPRDFADIQMEQGVIKQVFADKQNHLKLRQNAIQSEIDKSEKLLKGIEFETLKSIKELKISFLSEITNWGGIATQISSSGRHITSATTFLEEDDFDLSIWGNPVSCTVNYYLWNGSGPHHFSCNTFSEICVSYLEREKRIRLIEEDCIAEEQKKVEELKLELQDIGGWSIKNLIAKFGSEGIMSEEVQENKLLVFLLRRGYIDEKYANYINYFKGNTVTKDDMNFILSVKNMEPQPFNYTLTKTPMVAQRLQLYEFAQKAVYNFDLLECMMSFDDYREKLDAFINQLADADEQSWAFIDQFIDLTEHQNCFIKLLASAWPNMWGYIVKNSVLTYERKIHYLALLISNIDDQTIVLMNVNQEISDFTEQNEDILQQLTIIDSSKVIAVIETAQVKFNRVLIENVPEDVLDYIFDNDCYELNQLMIQHIVEHKNKDLVSDLETKNYTTIIKLAYPPLIKYVRKNLFEYIAKIVLAGEHAFDDENQILDLLERSIDNRALCNKLIEHEEFCLDDITKCCENQIPDKKLDVNYLWDTLLKNNKINPTWENVNRYWSEFEMTPGLVTYIENHVDNLVNADRQCIGDDFIKELIAAEIDDEAIKVLLPCIRMDDFDISLDTVAKSKVSLMINCRYFEFSLGYYEVIRSSFPDFCVEFILQNQAEYLDEIGSIQMDSNLLENLLLSNKIEAKTAQTLLDTFSNQHMTKRIAKGMKGIGLIIDLKVFNAAWGCLDEPDKQKLLLEHLDLLDADAFHSCFTDLGKWYSNFLDRSKKHVVELGDTPENQKLAERLSEVGYITSYDFKKKKEYDFATETDKYKTYISCRIKAIK